MELCIMLVTVVWIVILLLVRSRKCNQWRGQNNRRQHNVPIGFRDRRRQPRV